MRHNLTHNRLELAAKSRRALFASVELIKTHRWVKPAIRGLANPPFIRHTVSVHCKGSEVTGSPEILRYPVTVTGENP
jgi:hypothetical protein